MLNPIDLGATSPSHIHTEQSRPKAIMGTAVVAKYCLHPAPHLQCEHMNISTDSLVHAGVVLEGSIGVNTTKPYIIWL